MDAAGLQTVRAPTFTGNVSGDYVIHTGGGNLDLVASYFRTSSFSWDPSGQYREPAYGLLDTSLTWTAPSSKYDVQLWCKNCTDKYHDAFISEAALAIQRAASDPRTLGIQFGAHF
jgi:iron complex outermembrane receptor protein